MRNLTKTISTIVIILVGLFISQNTFAACNWSGNTCYVTTCEFSSLATDIAEVKTNELGKQGVVTIQCPTENITQTTDLRFSMTSEYSGITGLIIRGNGVLPISGGSTGLTIWKDRSIRAEVATGKNIRFSNITYTGTPNGDNWMYLSFIHIVAPSALPHTGKYRIDHITFVEPALMGESNAFRIPSNFYGVIDSCTGTVNNQFAGFGGPVSGEYGNATWNDGVSLGSSDAHYLENNIMAYNNTQNLDDIRMFADSSEHGGRVVVRYNTLHNFYIGGHDPGTAPRGALQYEIYNNTLVTDGGYVSGLLKLRGGTGVAFNNRIDHTLNTPFAAGASSGIFMLNWRDTAVLSSTTFWGTNLTKCDPASTEKACLGKGATWAKDGCTTEEHCGGTTGVTSYCLRVDGGGSVETHPQCRDQIGTGDNLSPQSSKPFLLWNNQVRKASGAWNDSPVYIMSGTTSIVKNRDYCEHSTTMPASCNGVTTSYTPYTYPHPLRGESDEVAPTATIGSGAAVTLGSGAVGTLY
jgi:hypothetical protein